MANKMDKTEFEEDILAILKKYGYKTEGIQFFNLRCSVDCIPEVDIEYYLM